MHSQSGRQHNAARAAVVVGDAQGLLQLQQQDPGPPPGLDNSAAQAPPNN
jgi:hypothetical protein